MFSSHKIASNSSQNVSIRRLKLLIIPLMLLFLHLSIIETAQAKDAKKCGKITFDMANQPNPIICEDGSPNSNAYAILKKQAPKTMTLIKTSTSNSIYKTMCEEYLNRDNWNSVGRYADVFAAYEYLYALYDWEGLRDSPDQLNSNFESKCNSITKSSSKAKFVGRWISWEIVNPASGIATFQITNNGGIAALPNCKVSVSDDSGVYKGFEYPKFTERVKPGYYKTYSIRIIVTKEGAPYITKGNVKC